MIEAHEYAKLFPMANETTLAEMAADIKQRNLLNPIILLDNQILDGRNRYQACIMAGVKPSFVDYEGTDPLADVLSWNLHRRQLTPSQLAMVALACKPMFEKLAKERQSELGKTHGDTLKANLPQGATGQSRDQAAAAVGVSGRLVQDAEYIAKHSPELAEKVKSGEKTVNSAITEIKPKRTPKRPAEFKSAEEEEAFYEKAEKTEKENKQKEAITDPLSGKVNAPDIDAEDETNSDPPNLAGLKRYWNYANKRERKAFLQYIKEEGTL
jgi:ParB-like chromosome segregation protein Spo0J